MIRKVTVLFLAIFLLTVSVNAQLEMRDIETVVNLKNILGEFDDAVINNLIIKDNFTSQGISHVYFKQQLNGIELYDSYAALHGKAGHFQFQTNRLIRGIKSAKIERSTAVSFEEILSKVVSQKKYPKEYTLTFEKKYNEPSQKSTYLASEVSDSEIQTWLVYVATAKNSYKLARVLTIDEVGSSDYLELLVDAESGQILRETNYTVYCDFGSSAEEHKGHTHLHEKSTSNDVTSFLSLAPNQLQVYAYPVESPLHGDQSVVTEPWLDGTASPNGWNAFGESVFQTTRGNNVDAYLDDNNTNSPTGGDAARASGGNTLEFLYEHNEGLPVDNSVNQDAALTNLFYWNNLVHDVWSNYGFDEASGNFQEQNYTGQGSGSDYVNAEAQDGGGTCNANMATPADGGNPRMQMYLCNGRDGDFDNGVVVHEYGHGISNRLTGGRTQAGCLGNQEQMGEGWSDYLGIVMTMEVGDQATDLRPIGNYLFGQGLNGGGIRTYPYTTDMSENPFTYDDIKTESVPHGVGSVWSTMLWDMTWALVDEYGFDDDLYNGTGGNNIAMKLVLEGMKLQPCSPGFVDGRDAIILADELLYEGANKCLIWQAFANRGLGFSASQGSSGSRSDGTESFDMPPECSISFDKTANISEVEPGQTIIYTLSATNNKPETVNNIVISDDLPEFTSFVNASDGGQLSGNTVVYPAFSLNPAETVSVTLEVLVSNGVSPNLPDFNDDLESGGDNWVTSSSGSTSFSLSTNTANSPVTSWFAPDQPTTGVANLEISSPIYVSSETELSFSHNYNTEASWDGGVVEISLNDGFTWIDLGSNFVSNGYNSTINNSRPAFSGNSGGFITSVVNLAPFAGQVAKIRFQMNCDVTIGGVGWYIDDIIATNQVLSIPNIAELDDEGTIRKGVLMNPTVILEDPSVLSITAGKLDPSCAGVSDGYAFVLASNGSGNYEYMWSTGSTQDTIFELADGSYSVTVDDGITSKIAQVNITNPPEIDIAMSATDAINNVGGSATATPSNGASPYSYQWSNGATTQTIVDLESGIYAVTVTDNNLCQKSDQIEVINPISCEINLIQIDIQMDNFPEDISIIVRDEANEVVFSKGPYSFVDDAELITEYVCVPDGCYSIEIDDAYGDGLCTYSVAGFYNIINYATSEILFSGCNIGGGITHDLCYPLLTHSIEKTNPSCTGLSDGSIDLTLFGGNPSVQIQYSNGATTEDISGLAEGQYSVEISDGVRTINDIIDIDATAALVYLSAGNGPGSLPYAVEETCPSDTIRFNDNLAGQTVLVDHVLTLGHRQSVKGHSASQTIISGMDSNQIFETLPNNINTLISLILADGQASANGGAIINRGSLTLENVSFQNNKEGEVSKSLTNEGDLFLIGTTIIQD